MRSTSARSLEVILRDARNGVSLEKEEMERLVSNRRALILDERDHEMFDRFEKLVAVPSLRGTRDADELRAYIEATEGKRFA